MFFTYRLQVLQIGSIKTSSQAGRNQTLHQEGNTEDVHTSLTQDLDLGVHRPSVVSAESTGDVTLTELSARLTDTNP